jgi:hypothetical protein
MIFYKTLFLIFLSVNICNAQGRITGKVINKEKEPIENANIVIFNFKTDNIISFSISNKNGEYSIIYPNELKDSIKIELSCLGYKNLIYNLKVDSNYKLNCILEYSETSLPDVRVITKSKPISAQGDTISYNTKSFSDSSDRVIIDVIKKLPGISVAQNGQILYNNKAINKFYIEGKDLLADRYNIATYNLPSSNVASVQVLQNHQPIKILENRIFSDRAAINIVLDKNSRSKLLINGHIGIGSTPFLNDNDISLLKFTKNLQFINSVKNNNIGKNLDLELIEHNQNVNNIENLSNENAQTRIDLSTPPNIEEQRYLFNNNALINSNYIFSTKSKYDIRFNIAFENDKNQNNPYSYTSIFLPKDTILIPEIHRSNSNNYKYITGFEIQKNSANYFILNSIKITGILNSEVDSIYPVSINQISRNQFLKITNNFNSIKKTNHFGMIGFRSYILYSNNPQSLTVTPGLYSNLLNKGNSYDGIIQKVNLQSLFSDNAATISFRVGKINFNNAIGIILQNQNQTNNLKTQIQNKVFDIDEKYHYDIVRDRFRIYNETRSSFFTDEYKLTFNLKNNYSIISNSDSINILKKLYLEPEARFQLNINNYWNLNFSATENKYLINDRNPSYILENYRNIVSNDVPIREIKNKYISIQIDYKNLIHALFLNFNIDKGLSSRNLIIENIYDSFLTKKNAILKDNNSNYTYYKISISKYNNEIKSLFNLNIGYNFSSSLIRQQGIYSSILNKILLIDALFNKRFKEAATINYSVNLNIDNSSSEQNKTINKLQPIYYFKQNISITNFLNGGFQTKINIEQYITKIQSQNRNNFTFLDLSILKKINKSKMDLSLSLLNLLNSNSYTSYTYLNNILITSNYPLRERMVLLKFSFQL